MDDLERALRDLLTDDRLDVPVQPGAVAAVRAGVRRRRRLRAAAVGAAGVSVVAAAIAVPLAVRGPEGTTPPPAGRPGPASYDVGWIAAPPPAHAWRPPMTKVSPPPMTAPPCRAGELQAAGLHNWGSSGLDYYTLHIRNVSTAPCLLVGSPLRVIATRPGHPSVVGTRGLDLPTGGVGGDLAPGRAGYLTLSVANTCVGYPTADAHRLLVTLPSGTTLNAPLGVDVTCGFHYGGLGIPWAAPHRSQDPRGHLLAAIDAPTSVPAGNDLSYVVTLSNPGPGPVSLSHCPGYVEMLGSGSGLRVKYAYRLNCAALLTIDAGASVRYEMRLAVPPAMAGDGVRLDWRLAVPGGPKADVPLQVR